MHNFTHSLAHRAPPASRTRGRWQPYAALQSASAASSSSSSSSTVSSTFSARISPANYLNTTTTPATSATSSPASSEADLSRPKDTCTREGNRTKYALNLVDQSVKSLCDIWRPQDIPAVYSNLKASETLQPAFVSQRVAKPTAPTALLAHHRLAAASQPSVPTTPVLIQTGTADVQPPLVPVRGFVHEVLKRSRTSGGVLQTALCYLEAIRPKLTDLIRQEKEGTATRGEPEPLSTITPATEEELALEAEFAAAQLDTVDASDITDTIRIDDDCQLQSPFANPDSPEIAPPSPPKPFATDFPPLPLLPSPLLCPRRSFLAALILASKFTQDKCYSNRAWAKLSGLSPREIGRCERALGDALDWRLWVGKAAAPAVPATTKPISRSQSDPSIFVSPLDAGVAANAAGLRRSSTLPADALSPPYLIPVEKHERCLPSDPPLYLQAPISKPDSGNPTGCSPLSDVPSLSYSPSSTESSSSGERTIQMSTFLEDNMVPPGVESTQSWPWLESEGSAASFMMNVDGAPKSSFMGAFYRHSTYASSSPVAKINGKLLTGNGLHAFQQHLQATPVGSFGDLSGHAAFAGIQGSGAVHIFDPSNSILSTTTFDVPSMG